MFHPIWAFWRKVRNYATHVAKDKFNNGLHNAQTPYICKFSLHTKITMTSHQNYNDFEQQLLKENQYSF